MTIGRTSIDANAVSPYRKWPMPSTLRRRPGPGPISLLTVVGLAAGLAACGGTQQPGSMTASAPADSNVPAAPNVDRSKCSDKGKQVITADTNQDKKPDVWKFFVVSGDVQVLSCKQV